VNNNTTTIKRPKFNKSIAKWPYIFLMPFVLSYIVFFLFPVFYSFYVSLFHWDVGMPKTFVGLKNYINLFTTDPNFLKSVGNTVIIMVITIPLLIFVGLFLSELLFNESLKGRNFFQTANFLPYITTPVAVAILFTLMFDQKVGIVNIVLVHLGIFKAGINWIMAPPFMQRMLLILMIVWEWSGYYMLMFLAGMSSISSDVFEAARVDGASRFTIFRKITVPLLSNVTFFLTITSIISMFQLLDQPYLLMRGLGQDSLESIENPLMTVMVNFMDRGLSLGRMGYGAAVTYSLFLIIMLFAFTGMGVLKTWRKFNEKN
jgi:cellobiose transport system permease protein